MHSGTAAGRAATREVPIYFPLSTNLASTTDHVQVLGPETSGEVEYALLAAPGGDLYVTVASDYSDRSFERDGVQLSKQLYPDVFAAEVWPYSEVESHWDDLVLDWLERLEQANLRQPGLVFLTGTLPTRRCLDRVSNE